MKKILDFFLQYLLKKILKNHSKNMKIFWNIERTVKKYTNICTFFWCSFNIFLKNIEEKNLVFYKCSFNILNKIWDLASCAKILSQGLVSFWALVKEKIITSMCSWDRLCSCFCSPRKGQIIVGTPNTLWHIENILIFLNNK